MNKVHYHHEKQRYSIRKYAFGAASVLIGCAYMANAQVAHADQTTASDSAVAKTVVENSGTIVVDKSTQPNNTVTLDNLSTKGSTWADSNVADTTTASSATTSTTTQAQPTAITAAVAESATTSTTAAPTQPTTTADNTAQSQSVTPTTESTTSTQPQTSTVSENETSASSSTDVTKTVVVTYPDGSTDEVQVHYTVAKETDADKNEPTVRTQIVHQGQTPTADSFITNKDSLPAGTTYSFKDDSAPKTGTPATTPTSTKPGTSETVKEPAKPAETPVTTPTTTKPSTTETVKETPKTETQPATTTKDDASKEESKPAEASAKDKVVKEVVTGPELPARGRYTFTEKTAVYTTPSTNSSVSFYFNKGNQVNYDKVLDAENARWISYVSYSGIRRYAKVGELTKVREEVTEPESTEGCDEG